MGNERSSNGKFLSRSAEERFEEKVLLAESGCWVWQAALTTEGYGQFWYDNRQGFAHRFAYETFVGPIPPGLTLDHLCRNRVCVNPAHLDAVPIGVNILRGMSPSAVNARKTHCVNGHEFTPENTYIYKEKRKCRACRREDDLARWPERAAIRRHKRICTHKHRTREAREICERRLNQRVLALAD